MGSRSQTSQSVPPWALPYAQGLLGTGTGLVAPGAVDPTTGSINPKYLGGGLLPVSQLPPGMLQKVAPFNPTQQAGLDYLTGSAGQSAQLAGAGANQVQQTLGGQYLSPDSNPYLAATGDALTRALTNQYKLATAPSLMAQAQQGGNLRGSAFNEQQAANQFGLGQNISDTLAQLYGGNYEAERARQQQAVGMIPGVQGAIQAPGQQLLGAGTLQQGQTQTELDVARQNAELQTQYPFTILSYLGNLLGTSTGAGGVVTSGTSK